MAFYGMAVTLGILFFFITISTLVTFFCARSQFHLLPPSRRRLETTTEPDVERGLDEATLRSYPKVVYRELPSPEKATTAACCSICLADYKESDVLRRLLECGHLFHVRCVDPWLRRNPTCPVCRTSPMPSPAGTPMAAMEFGREMVLS